MTFSLFRSKVALATLIGSVPVSYQRNRVRVTWYSKENPLPLYRIFIRNTERLCFNQPLPSVNTLVLQFFMFRTLWIKKLKIFLSPRLWCKGKNSGVWENVRRKLLSFSISQLVTALWLVYLASRISMSNPPNSKVYLNRNLPPSIWTQKYNEYLTDFVFSHRTVSYGTFFPLGLLSASVARDNKPMNFYRTEK